MKYFSVSHLCLIAALLLTGIGCSSNKSSFSGAAGMFLTENSGTAWVQQSVLPTAAGPQSLAGVSVYRLYDDPQDPNAMYWASREHGMFYSYNNGQTWNHAPAPLNTGFIYSIAVHPKNKCLIFATNGFRVYKSVDCNRSWEEVHREERPGAQITSLEFHTFEPYELFMTKKNGEVVLSSDLGISWAIVSREANNLVHIESDPTVADRMYLSTERNGLFRSTDRGRTWENLSAGFQSFASALEHRRFFLDSANSGHLYWVSTYGILRSIDGGDTWEALRLLTSPGSANIYGLAVNPTNHLELYYVATIGERSIFYHSRDGGVSWVTEPLPSGQVPTALRIHPTEPQRLFLGFTILPQS